MNDIKEKILEQENIHAPTKCIEELNKLNIIDFSCVIEMFNELKIQFFSDLNITKKQCVLYVEFESGFNIYTVEMQVIGNGRFEYIFIKERALFT